MNHDDDLVFALQAATIPRPGSAFALRDIQWSIRDGETWAIVGPVGSGKTMLAETILGRHRLATGAIHWPLLDRLRAAGRVIEYPSEHIRMVSFREESRLFSPSKHYYQQRFNFIDPLDDLTLEEFLRASGANPSLLEDMASRFGLLELLPLSFVKLSHGQSRRARLAQALLARPELLILDDPFLGLDVAARNDLAEMLGDLVRSGARLLLITQPHAMPNWVTHVLDLDAGAVRWQGPRKEYSTSRSVSNPPHPYPSPPQSRGRGGDKGTESGDRAIVELRNVSVRYGEKLVLDDIYWTVRAGEKWAVLGPNGAGKTTLLSLLCGDHPQAYCNDIRLFGRQRGSGESIWDIKRRIGLVSPELHVYFTEPLTAERAAATGFSDTLTPPTLTHEQNSALADLLAAFGIAALAQRLFSELSAGEQRLVLIVRALVKNPPLLILDEPFQGLDASTVHRVRNWLDKNLRPEQSLLFVTHHEEEIPQCVTHRLRLASPIKGSG